MPFPSLLRAQQLEWALLVTVVIVLPASIIAAMAQNEGSRGSSPGPGEVSATNSAAAESRRLNAEGLRLMEGGQISRASEEFRRAVKANPGNTEALNNLGIAGEKGVDIEEWSAPRN